MAESQPTATTARTPLDQVPGSTEHAQRAVFAARSPEERAAAYLNSIRRMAVFFVWLAIIGIVAGIVVGVVGIVAIDHANQQQTTGLYVP